MPLLTVDAVSTGIPALDELISGPRDACPGYPLGRIVTFLVQEEDRDAVCGLLKGACASVCLYRTGPTDNGRETMKALWDHVRAEEGPKVHMIYDMELGLPAIRRSQLWSSLMPKLNAVLRHDNRACVVGLTTKGKDTSPERMFSAVRIEVERVPEGYEFVVHKSMVSDAAGRSTKGDPVPEPPDGVG